MKLFAAYALAAVALFSGCDVRLQALDNLGNLFDVPDVTTIHGSGVKASETRQVDTFRRVVLKGSGEVDIRVGLEPSLTVEIDDNLLPIISTQVNGSTLTIENKESYRSKIGLHVIITVPELERVSIAGSGDIRVQELRGESFAVRIAGSGDVTASGAAEKVSVDIAGSGDVELDELEARDVTVKIAGSGDARVHATETLAATILGSGDVRYAGNPKVNKTVLGSGNLRKE